MIRPDSRILIALSLAAVIPLRASAPSLAGPRAHTFSIVAFDGERGEMGVAVQSHWFNVGPVVAWAEPGVGALATQALVNVSYGPLGLDMLRSGLSAQEVVSRLTGNDEGASFRQLAVVDAAGGVAAHTGAKCIPEAGHSLGVHFSAQANMMLKPTVWPAMKTAFEASSGPLAERLLGALEAAQAEGGDIRGMQSAALVVVRVKATGKPWEDRLVDLRVDDHEAPLVELGRLLRLHRAYESMNRGDLAMERNDTAAALEFYGTAESLFPENLEMRYWHAVSLANAGRVEESLFIFRAVFQKDANWRELTRRLPGVGLLNAGPESLKRILELR